MTDPNENKNDLQADNFCPSSKHQEDLLNISKEFPAKNKRSLQNHKKVIKLQFDMLNEKDSRSYLKLMEVCHNASMEPHSPPLRPSVILKEAIELVTEDFAKKIQGQFLSDQDKLETWCRIYNEKNGANLSPLQFAVRVMSGLKKKDLEILPRFNKTKTELLKKF